MCINAYSRCGPRHRHSRDVLHVAQPPVHVQVEVILQHGPNPAINLLYGSSCCSVHNSIAQGQSAREGTDRPGIPLLTADNTQAAAFWQSSAAPPALCAGPPKNVTKWYWLPSPPQGQGVFVGATGVPRKEEGPTPGIHPLLHSL